MKLLVLGASGRIGRHVVEQALGHGHDVTVLVRDPTRQDLRGEQLRVVGGDVTDPAAVGAAVEGQDAAISALTAGAEEPASAYADATANLVRAMTARGVHRLVVASAAGLGGHAAEVPLAYRVLLLAPGAARRRAALEDVEGEVMLSDLEWTIVRAPLLTDRAQTGHYRVVEGPVVPRGLRIGRADLAAMLLKSAETGRFPRRVVSVAY